MKGVITVLLLLEAMSALGEGKPCECAMFKITEKGSNTERHIEAFYKWRKSQFVLIKVCMLI